MFSRHCIIKQEIFLDSTFSYLLEVRMVGVRDICIWLLRYTKKVPFKYFFGEYNTAWKVSKYVVISGLYFPVFGLNTEIHRVNLRIQSEYREIRTRNNYVFGHFLRSVNKSAGKMRTSSHLLFHLLHW